MIRGARQVGKSTLVRRFTRNNGLILNEINLEQHLYLDNIVNEGKLAEQFVGQHLVNPFEQPRLIYWLREAKSANAEVDYVTTSGSQVIPIEVKAGKSGTLKSLQQFVLNKQADLCIRFDLNRPDTLRITHAARVSDGSMPVSYTLLSLPLYIVEELPRLVKEIRMDKIT